MRTRITKNEQVECTQTELIENEEGLKMDSEEHTFVSSNYGMTRRCSKCGWTFDLPPNENQQLVIMRKRRKYQCPLTEEMKQKYGFGNY